MLLDTKGNTQYNIYIICRVPNSGEMVMRALLANSTGKNPVICKVEDKKFVINVS